MKPYDVKNLPSTIINHAFIEKVVLKKENDNLPFRL